MRRRLLTAVVASLVLASGWLDPSSAGATTPATLLQVVAEEADYILTMRNGEGIITTVPTKDKVVPYHANFAAIGLARAYRITRDARYSSAAWRWLEWYRDHMTSDGTISNYVRSSSWIPEGLPDSTDSYAGTYLSAVLATFEATLDVQRLQGLRLAVGKAVGAIELTEDTDGLHFARPGWPFKYSMDEAEAFAGFNAAVKLAGYLRDDALKARAAGDAARLRAGADANLVDHDPGPGQGLYLWAVHHDGTKVTAPISWIYPGASAQVWAITDGLVTGAPALALMQRVEAAQPYWDNPLAITQWYDGNPSCYGAVPCMLPVSYWPRFAYAWITLGDSQRALTSIIRIRTAAIQSGRAYPFTPGDAGQIIMTLADSNTIAASAAPVRLPVVLPA